MKNFKHQILAISIILCIFGCSILSEKTKISIHSKIIKNMETRADYTKILPFTLKWEGGVSDQKDDLGGLTNKGITYKTYRKLCKKVYNCEPSEGHFISLKYEDLALMVRHFWNVATCNNSINSQKVSEAIFNWHWGSGLYGLKLFQQMLNDEFGKKLVVDGIIGAKTIEAINSINEDQLFRAAIYHRYLTFQSICRSNPSQKVFLQGWLNRLSDFAKRHGENLEMIIIANR